MQTPNWIWMAQYTNSTMRLKHLPILQRFLQNACCLMRSLLCYGGIVDMMGCNKNSTVNVNCLAFKSFRCIKTPRCVHSMHTLQLPYKASSFQRRRRCLNFAVLHRPCMLAKAWYHFSFIINVTEVSKQRLLNHLQYYKQLSMMYLMNMSTVWCFGYKIVGKWFLFQYSTRWLLLSINLCVMSIIRQTTCGHTVYRPSQSHMTA